MSDPKERPEDKNRDESVPAPTEEEAVYVVTAPNGSINGTIEGVSFVNGRAELSERTHGKKLIETIKQLEALGYRVERLGFADSTFEPTSARDQEKAAQEDAKPRRTVKR